MINTKIVSVSFSLAEYGLRAQIITIMTLCSSFFSFGLSHAATYFIPITDNSDNKAWLRVLRNIYILLVPICMLVVLLITIFGNNISIYFHNELLNDYSCIIIVMGCEHIIYSLYAGTQIAQHKAKKSTLTNSARAIVSVITTGILCITKQSIRHVIIGMVCVDSLFCIYTVLDVVSIRIKIQTWLDTKLEKDILKYCIPLGLSIITGTLCAQIDKLFISNLLSIEDLAIYTNMCTELPLSAISGAFISILTPYVVKMIKIQKTDNAIQLWGIIIELVAIILLPIITGLFVFAKQAILILYSKEYVVGYHLFRLFVILELSRITYFGLILRSYGKSMLILLCSVATLVVNVLFNALFYFVFQMGMYGFALATLISTFSILLIQLVVSARLTKTKFGSIFPWRRVFICLSVNILLGSIVIILSKCFHFYDSFDVLKIIITCILWFSIYFLIEKRRIKKIYHATKEFSML